MTTLFEVALQRDSVVTGIEYAGRGGQRTHSNCFQEVSGVKLSGGSHKRLPHAELRRLAMECRRLPDKPKPLDYFVAAFSGSRSPADTKTPFGTGVPATCPTR